MVMTDKMECKSSTLRYLFQRKYCKSQILALKRLEKGKKRKKEINEVIREALAGEKGNSLPTSAVTPPRALEKPDTLLHTRPDFTWKADGKSGLAGTTRRREKESAVRASGPERSFTSSPPGFPSRLSSLSLLWRNATSRSWSTST